MDEKSDFIKELEQEVENEMSEDTKEEKEENKNEKDNENNTETNTEKDEEEKENSNAKEENGEKEQEESKIIPINILIDGETVELRNAEEIVEYITNNSTKSTKEKALKDSNISDGDIALLAAIKEGDINAVFKLAKNNNLDIMMADIDELDDGKEYELQSKENTAVDNIANEILSNPEKLKAFDAVMNDALMVDESFAKAITQENVLKVFTKHLENGTAEKLMPEAKRLARIKGIPVFDAYTMLGESELSKNEEKDTTQVSRGKEGTRENPKKEVTEDDIDDMDEEEFEKYLESQRR